MAGLGETDSLNDSKPPTNYAAPSPRRRLSKTAEYFAKIANGDHYCIVCKDQTPSKEVLLKKEKHGSTSRLWRHLKKAHPAIYRKIRNDVGQPSVADIFTDGTISKQDSTSLVVGRTIEELLCFIFFTKASFDITESPALKRLASYYAQHDVNLPDSQMIQLAAFKKYEEGKASLRQMLGQVHMVSLTMDAWSTKNKHHILMIMVHWIDDAWALCERVLGVEEIVGPHSGDSMAEVLIRILKDFSLMDKVCAVTLNKSNNSSAMVVSLAKALKDTDARFNKLYHMPCLAQVVNQVVEEGFKQLSILTKPSAPKLIDELVVDTVNPTKPSNESMEPTSSMIGMLVDRLRCAIRASQEPHERLMLYKVLCEELGMPNKKKLVLDSVTGWYSTYEMIVVALEKRQVLDKMASNAMNELEIDFSITVNEWELLKMFASVLSPYHDCVELLCRSKTVSASTALRILEALLSMVASWINDLDKLLSTASNSTWSAEQQTMLKDTYIVMKEKLVKYDNSLKRSLAFVIAAALDPHMKLSYSLSMEQDFVYDSLLRLVEEVEDETTSNQSAAAKERDRDSIIQSWRKGILPKGFNLIEAAIKSSQLKMRREKLSVREELDEYFGEACIGDDPLAWWRDIGCLRFPRLAVLAKDYLSICAASTSFDSIFAGGQRIVPYKWGNLNAESAAVLMTLKCWSWEDPEDRMEEDMLSNSELDD